MAAPQLDPAVQYGILGALILVISWLIKTLHDQTNFTHKLIDRLMGKIDDSNEVATRTALAIQGFTDALREYSDKTTREHNRLSRSFGVYKDREDERAEVRHDS